MSIFLSFPPSQKSKIGAYVLRLTHTLNTTTRSKMAIAEPQTTSKKEVDEISLADSDDMGVDDDAAFALPPTKIEIDPSTGIKTVTEYRVKEDGSKVRSIKRVKVHKVSKTVTKEMLERKNWARFGDAARYKTGDESMTAVSLEEIFLERARVATEIGVGESERSVEGDGEQSNVSVSV